MATEQQQRSNAVADITRAGRATEFLNNPLYLEAITSIRAAMFEQFQDSKFKDEEQRHELWQRMQLLKQFQGKFESIVKQGEKGRKTLTLLDRAKQLIS